MSRGRTLAALGAALATAEVLEGTFVLPTERAMEATRLWHSATALSDGTVLVVGDAPAGTPAEIFLR